MVSVRSNMCLSRQFRLATVSWFHRDSVLISRDIVFISRDTVAWKTPSLEKHPCLSPECCKILLEWNYLSIFLNMINVHKTMVAWDRQELCAWCYFTFRLCKVIPSWEQIHSLHLSTPQSAWCCRLSRVQYTVNVPWYPTTAIALDERIGICIHHATCTGTVLAYTARGWLLLWHTAQASSPENLLHQNVSQCAVLHVSVHNPSSSRTAQNHKIK